MPRPDGTLYNFERPANVRKPPVKVVRLKPEVVKVRPRIELPDLRFKLRPTPELMERLCSAVKGGLSPESALVREGLSRSRAPGWLKMYPAAQVLIEKAEAEWEADMLANVAKFAGSESKSAQWLLERRAPARWAPVNKQELTGKDGAPIAALTLSKQLIASVGGQADERLRQPKRVQPATTNDA